MDGGFFEKFGSQLKLAAEPTQEIKDEENRERVNYQDETESTEDEPRLSDSQPSLTSVLELNVSRHFSKLPILYHKYKPIIQRFFPRLMKRP